MKRLVLVLVIFLCPSICAVAQNNPYKIDDECFVHFTAAEHSVDDFFTDAFETAQQLLLETSLRKKDTKAQTLYYVEQLKHTSHQAQFERSQNHESWDRQGWNAKVDDDKETLQRVAKATGYMQYYYYATEMCQTYYYNTSQDIVAKTMLQNMMSEARETGDEYGLWKSLMYLGKLYQRINDKYSTQKILLEVVRIHETTQDPMIHRQSMAVQYCELACTYPVASDSARLFYSRAEQSCATKLDTMRVNYFKAQLAAWDGNIADYRKNKEYCLSMAPFTKVIRGGDICFECIDALLDGKSAKVISGLTAELHPGEQPVFIYSFAGKLGRWEIAAPLLNKQVNHLYSSIYTTNSQHLEETAALYGNHRLSADLAQASRKVTRITVLVAVLLTILLVVALLVVLRHLHSVKRAYAKDEALIAGMKEKNK